MPVVAFLANGQRAVYRRWVRPLYAYAPTKIEYAIDRFTMETKRLLDVLDKRLADNEYLAGDVYTISDIAAWPWFAGLASSGSTALPSFSRCTNIRT
jgi:glutathione S-transferase